MAIRNNTLALQSKSEAKPSTEETRAALERWVEAHRTILEILLDAYCVVDLQNQIVDFNVAFTDLCGESYRKVMRTRDFCTLLRTEVCPTNCPSVQAINSRQLIRLDELKGNSKAFSELQLIVAAAPISNEQNEILGAVVTIRNVSAESELQKKYDERKKESSVDGLTQLYNKVYTEAVLLKMFKTVLRDKKPLSVLMCDIDHFKKVNDKYGHQAGDLVLSAVAKLLKDESRDSDICGRFGGEEFIVGLYGTDIAGAQIYAERFRKKAEALKVDFEGKTIPVTVSIGTSSFVGKWAAGFNHEEELKKLISQADTALYYSKANGRNTASQFENIHVQGGLAPGLTSEKKKG
jgi:diguanylate cyclase (GGDEF)-like protein